jgi:hypothetical protein
MSTRKRQVNLFQFGLPQLFILQALAAVTIALIEFTDLSPLSSFLIAVAIVTYVVIFIDLPLLVWEGAAWLVARAKFDEPNRDRRSS